MSGHFLSPSGGHRGYIYIPLSVRLSGKNGSAPFYRLTIGAISMHLKNQVSGLVVERTAASSRSASSA